VPLFKERAATSMPPGYIFNAPREKYASSANYDWICVRIIVGTATLQNEKQMTGLESCMKTHMLVSV
jgi:hypothetical protein